MEWAGCFPPAHSIFRKFLPGFLQGRSPRRVICQANHAPARTGKTGTVSRYIIRVREAFVFFVDKA